MRQTVEESPDYKNENIQHTWIFLTSHIVVEEYTSMPELRLRVDCRIVNLRNADDAVRVSES